MSSCVTPTAFGKLQEHSTYVQHQGPVRADSIVLPCSSSPAWGLTAQLIFTLVFVLLFHCYTASKFFVQVGQTSSAGFFVMFLSLKSLKLVVLITYLVKVVPKHLAKWKLWHGDHHKILLAADQILNTSTAYLTFGQFLY